MTGSLSTQNLLSRTSKGNYAVTRGISASSSLSSYDIQLVTKVKNNMKNSLMTVADKIMLRKRAVVESVNDELKNIAQIEHSRYRSFINFITNALSAIAAYCFFPKKPSISLEFITDNQLTLF